MTADALKLDHSGGVLLSSRLPSADFKEPLVEKHRSPFHVLVIDPDDKICRTVAAIAMDFK